MSDIRDEAGLRHLRQETEKLTAEAQKLEAERRKLQAETDKLTAATIKAYAETAKIQSGLLRFEPWKIAFTAFGAGAAFVAALVALLGLFLGHR